MTNKEAIAQLEWYFEEDNGISADLVTKQAFNTIKEALSQEPCEDIAQERYKDLCEYFGDAKDILKSREDFKAWLERVKWHIRKAEELYEKYEYKQEPCDDAISRETVLGLMQMKMGAKELYIAVHDLPSVTQKSGKWIVWNTDSYDWTYKCSRCGYIERHKSNYLLL